MVPSPGHLKNFALHALTYGRSQTVYEAAGRQELRWTAAKAACPFHLFLPGTMRGSTVMDGRGLSRIDLDAVDLGDKDFTIGRFQIPHAPRSRRPRSDLVLRPTGWHG